MKSINNFANRIICGDCLEAMKQMPDGSINCVITSPHYWKLRDYGWPGQWGRESSYQEYLERLWQMMDEVKRILKDDGTVWINLGDTYGNSGEHSKCQLLLPHKFAIGCIKRGWIIRNDIIWAKRNGMPEGVKDRFSKKHEYIFFMVKNKKYYFDLDSIRDKHVWAGRDRRSLFCQEKNITKILADGRTIRTISYHKNGKNPGDVSDFWDIIKKPSNSEHCASFNSMLITKPIIAGCPKNGIVLDPFCGSGTTLSRAKELGRRFIGIDGKKEYCKMAEERVEELLK